MINTSTKTLEYLLKTRNTYKKSKMQDRSNHDANIIKKQVRSCSVISIPYRLDGIGKFYKRF
jgi:hypothetical protein